MPEQTHLEQKQAELNSALLDLDDHFQKLVLYILSNHSEIFISTMDKLEPNLAEVGIKLVFGKKMSYHEASHLILQTLEKDPATYGALEKEILGYILASARPSLEKTLDHEFILAIRQTVIDLSLRNFRRVINKWLNTDPDERMISLFNEIIYFGSRLINNLDGYSVVHEELPPRLGEWYNLFRKH